MQHRGAVGAVGQDHGGDGHAFLTERAERRELRASTVEGLVEHDDIGSKGAARLEQGRAVADLSTTTRPAPAARTPRHLAHHAVAGRDHDRNGLGIHEGERYQRP